MNQIFAQLFYEMEKHRDTVLVTLIDAAGSAPRKSGSQMLVGASGRLTGTIGGGAVERRSEEMAMALLREKRSAVHDFLLHTAASRTVLMRRSVMAADFTVGVVTSAKSSSPLCRTPKRSPGPRNCISRFAISNPSLDLQRISSRSRICLPSRVCRKMQYACALPRPTRPRS